MSQTLPLSPALSPSFDRARKLSRVMAVLFTIGFWLVVAILVLLLLLLIWPLETGMTLAGEFVLYADLSWERRLVAFLAPMIGFATALVLLHHVRNVFNAFAQGQVFAPITITHIRSTGVWLVISFFAGLATMGLMIGAGLQEPEQIMLDFWPLIVGVITFIIAHVMTEAARIAADNAEIV